MYCEYLIPDAKKGDRDSLEQLFFANYNLIYLFERDFHVFKDESEDFSQICFIAFEKAVKEYQLGSLNSLLAYYRRCVQHEFYLYKLLMRYPTRVSRSDIKKIESDGFEFTNLCSESFAEMDDVLSVVEIHTISAVVWREVERILGYQHCMFLKNRFVFSMKYDEILIRCEERGKTVQQLRDRQAYLLRRLRKSRLLREIAYDFFSIQC